MVQQTEWVIDVHELTKSFAKKKAVDHVSLKVKAGEIFGFLGPNGSGKTTTIRMLCGLLTPDSGSGTCLGYDLLKQSDKIKRQVGYMTQHFSLYQDLTVLENLMFTANIYEMSDPKRRVNEQIERLELGPYTKQLTGRLSGGWKQRLALAAALLHDPKLLLLDEPTAGVDPKARREFWNHIHQLAATGITSLVSTHYMDEAERCHRLAYIAQGQLLVEGTTKEVVDDAKLTTWLVRGEKLVDLASKLENLPGVEQTITFGDSLHVSGKDAAKLASSIEKFKTLGYQWQEVETNLEDVFIYLVSHSKEGPADE